MKYESETAEDYLKSYQKWVLKIPQSWKAQRGKRFYWGNKRNISSDPAVMPTVDWQGEYIHPKVYTGVSYKNHLYRNKN